MGVQHAVFGLLLAAAVANSAAVELLEVSVEHLKVHSASASLPPVLGLEVATPRLSWVLGSEERNTTQTSYWITVSSPTSICSSGTQLSSETHLVKLPCSLGEADTVYTISLGVTASSGATTETSFAVSTGLRDSAWQGDWITGGFDANQLRKEFKTTGAISQAFLYISGIGYYQASLNGNMLDADRRLDVGWTDFAKRVYYATFDVTKQLQAANALAVMLGNGWYSCGDPNHPTTQPACVSEPPMLKMQLNIRYADGTTTTVASDTSFKASPGPILYNSLYNGETYDARNETPGWNQPGFDDSSWRAASLASSTAQGYNATMTSQTFEPIRGKTTLAPKAVTEPEAGVYVLDYGQNHAGVIRMTLPAGTLEAGQQIILRHAEVLMHPPYGPKNGSIYTGNLRAAKATDVYIASGSSDGEVYQPTFTQHGYRYVEVGGLGRKPQPGEFVSVVLGSDVDATGHLSLGDGLLTDIQNAVVWGQKSNLMSVPTDCPQRDERRGWMGDAALTVEEAMYNFRLGAFYTHWLDSIQDDQNPDGSVDNYVPRLDQSSAGSPNWQSAYPDILDAMLLYNGDSDVVTAHWPSVQQYYNWWMTTYKAHGFADIPEGFGDWVPPPPHPKADPKFTSGFAFLHDLYVLKDLAAAVSDTAMADEIDQNWQTLADAFNAQWFNASAGYYNTGLQTEQALPLWLGIVPAEYTDQVLNYTIHDILVTQNTHTTTGIIGQKFMFEALSKYSAGDVALAMCMQTTYPSYGFMIKNPDEPATTIWELWDTPSEGPSMNSRNHIMFGTVSSWFWKYLVGLRPLTPGFRTVQFKPDTSAIGKYGFNGPDATLSTPYGIIGVSMIVNGSTPPVNANVSVPVGVTAHVHLPLLKNDPTTVDVSEGTNLVFHKGKPVQQADVACAVSDADDTIRCIVGSGTYAFSLTATA